MKRLQPILLSAIGLALPFITFAQVIATDVQCTPPGCVGTIDLANSAVTAAKLSNGAVTSAKISDGTITNSDISNAAAIDPSKIAGVDWAKYGYLGIDGTPVKPLTIYAGDNDALALFSNSSDDWYVGPNVAAPGFGIYDVTQGNSRLHISMTGNVGIGTTEPWNTLDVRRDNTDGDVISFGSQSYVMGRLGEDGSINKVYLANTYNSDVSSIDFRLKGTAPSDSKMIIQGNGNVGIGMTNPTNAFSVYMPYTVNADTRISLANDYVNMGMVGRSNEYGQFRLGFVDDSGTEALTLRYGNVGIGTSTPAYRLDVSGSVNSSALCLMGDCRTTWPADGGGGTITGSGTSGYISQWTGATSIADSPLYVSGTSVGIGTTSPSQKLDVNGSLAIDNVLYGPSDTSLTLQAASDRALIFNTNGSSERMRIDKDGNVGIGTSSPATKLTIASSNDLALYATSSTADDGEGAIYAESNNTGNHNTIGIQGVTKSYGNAYGQPIGVEGVVVAAQEPTSGAFGVLGYSYLAAGGGAGTGVWGGSVGRPGDEGAFGDYDSDLGQGVVGETFSRHNGAAGVWGTSRASDGWGDGVYGETHSSQEGSYGVFSSGPFAATGTKSAVVYTDSQGPTELFVVESPDNWFEDIGFNQLHNGTTTIKIDPVFLETVTIDSANPYHVFVEAYDNTKGHTLNVQKSAGSFTVTDPLDENSNLTFSYRLIAKRKYYENKRLPAVPVTIDQFMRPDLSTQNLIDLNQRWGIDSTTVLNQVRASPQPSH